jgi:hypothetical protein
MTNKIDLRALLSNSDRTLDEKLMLFVWLNLGIVESLANGLLTATQAVRIFFNADNCLFVRQEITEQGADVIMSRGTQLADLFEALVAEEAQREFQRELATIRSLCLNILEKRRVAA